MTLRKPPRFIYPTHEPMGDPLHRKSQIGTPKMGCHAGETFFFFHLKWKAAASTGHKLAFLVIVTRFVATALDIGHVAVGLCLGECWECLECSRTVHLVAMAMRASCFTERLCQIWCDCVYE